MTDTVNVPEVGMEDAPDWYCHDSASGWACGWNACREYSLAAAPKAEPVSDPYKLVREAISNLIEWDKKTGFRVPYRVRDPLYSALALIQPLSNPQQLPEAPKVEQEPFGHWVEHTVGEPVFIRNGSYVPKGENYTVTPLYTPAPASDELPEALKLIERFRKDYNPYQDDQLEDDAADFIAKHMGPQS